jgi:hypothetical protein
MSLPGGGVAAVESSWNVMLQVQLTVQARNDSRVRRGNVVFCCQTTLPRQLQIIARRTCRF